MFYDDGAIVRSDILDIPGVMHAFSTRLGGVSTNPHTMEMNIAPGHGDDDDTVRRNTDILVGLMSGGAYGAEDAVVTSQIHSAKVRLLDRTNRGEGVVRAVGEPCDGFVTDCRGVVPIVRTADCVPILMCGLKATGEPVIASLHAGWRGTAQKIAAEGVRVMISLGADPCSIRAAVGPHIGFCCFEVGEDMYDAVKDMCGADFAARHIKKNDTLHADLTGMNTEILTEAGVRAEHIDVSCECTMCLDHKYHSHRKTHGLRGAMGSLIAIL